MENTQIYLHVGLGKNASKYFQYKVFPYFKGVHYIQRTSYRNCKEIVARKESSAYFISNEFDRQMERECKWLSEDFPKAKVFLFVRSNESWIASQYRRFLKNAETTHFTDFFDVEEDKGLWKIKDAELMRYIKIVERYFEHKPLVLLYEDFRANPLRIIRQIAAFVGATFNERDINLKPKHTSYNEKQLKVMRKIGPKILSAHRKDSSNLFMKALLRYSRWSIIYPILFVAKFLPESWIDKKPLIPRDELDKVKKYFEKDREECVAYAKESQRFYGLDEI